MTKRQFAILSFILLILPSTSLAQEDTWTRKVDMPTARWHILSIAGHYFSMLEVHR